MTTSLPFPWLPLCETTPAARKFCDPRALSRKGSSVLLCEQPFFRFCQGGARLVVRARKIEIQFVERRCDDLRDLPALVMFVVRRDCVPRRPRTRRRAKAFLVSGHVLVPAVALVEVAGIELPVLLRLVDALEESL